MNKEIDISKGFGAIICLTLALNEHKMNEEQKAKSKEYRNKIEEIMYRKRGNIKC